MPRIVAISLALALLAGAAPAFGEPFFLVYAVPAQEPPDCTLGMDPSTYQPEGGGFPVLPRQMLAVGLPPESYDLCFLNWPISASDMMTVPGKDGNGTEVCFVKLSFSVNGGGVTIDNFEPAGPDPEEDFPTFKSVNDSTSLTVVGGHPLDCQLGVAPFTGVYFGTLEVTATGAPATLEFQEGTFSDAANVRTTAQTAVLLETLDGCGDGIVDSSTGEECDDMNADAGDGCLACVVEEGFSLTGDAGDTGTFTFKADGVPLTIDFSVLQGLSAAEVVLASRFAVQAAQLSEGAQVDDPDQPEPDDGRRFVYAGTIADPEVQTNGTLALPEPGQLVSLGAGIAYLLALARRRRS